MTLVRRRVVLYDPPSLFWTMPLALVASRPARLSLPARAADHRTDPSEAAAVVASATAPDAGAALRARFAALRAAGQRPVADRGRREYLRVSDTVSHSTAQARP